MSTYTISGDRTIAYTITAPTTVVINNGSIHATGGVGIFGGGFATHYTVANYGAITVPTRGVALHGGVVINGAGGTIVGTNGAIVEFYTGGAGTVINQGAMATGTTTGLGIHLRLGGQVTNTASGVIAASDLGVYLDGGGAGTVTNAGTISSSANCAVKLGSHAGSRVVNSGLITSAATAATNAAVFLSNGTGLTNTGTIAGTGTGGHGVTLDWPNVTVTNAGTITGASAGALMLVGGVVNNQTAAYLGGTVFGVRAMTSGSGTIDNAGTIKGGSYAVYFHTYYCTLTAEAGSKLVGAVASGNTNFKSLLVFGAAGGPGTLSGLGGGTITSASIGTFAVTYFNRYQVAAGGTWDVAGTVASHRTLDVEGRIALSGTLTATGKLNGAGTIGFKGGVLHATTSMAAAPKLDFAAAPSGSEAILSQGGAVTYAGVSVINFGLHGTLDLTGITYAAGLTTTYSAGTLYLNSSGHTLLARLPLTKEPAVTHFTTGTDAGIGTLITAGGSPPPPSGDWPAQQSVTN